MKEPDTKQSFHTIRRNMLSEKDFPIKGKRYLTVVACFLTAGAFLYGLEGLWDDYTWILYAITGILGLLFCGICILYGRILFKPDTVLLLLITVFTWLSSVLSFGLSSSFFFSKFFCGWCFLLCAYFAVRISPEPEKTLFHIAEALVLGLSVSSISVLFRATASLLTIVPGSDTIHGCFQLGRLCGLGNANVFSFSCAALFYASFFCFLSARKRFRLLFFVPGLIGWFCLGLTNCRTAIIGVSVSVGLFVFSCCLFPPRRSGGAASNVWRWILAVSSFFLITAVMVYSFYLPMYLYRGVLLTDERILQNPAFAAHVQSLVSRPMTDGETVVDRVQTWKKCLEEVFKTSRRTWFGISVISQDGIAGIYPAHHEIVIPHAHSTYLEILRRNGLIGFLLWLSAICYWAVHGIVILFRSTARASVCCLITTAAGILLMGFAEPILFYPQSGCALSLLFLLACAYCIDCWRDRK